jgi:hypothetical protein
VEIIISMILNPFLTMLFDSHPIQQQAAVAAAAAAAAAYCKIVPVPTCTKLLDEWMHC